MRSQGFLKWMVLLWAAAPAAVGLGAGGGTNVLESVGPDAGWTVQGVVGQRLRANIDQWLLHAPAANPGMLEMFRVRDRKPAPELVPWAGEFAGKYLLSAVQALELTGSPALRGCLEVFVRDLLATQAADGYLGPFPERERLLGHWDLWGHYHVMQGLLRWHDLAGDPAALVATRRAADLICATYLDGHRRVLEAGSPEMNMAVIHVLVQLHRRLGEPRYLSMAREIERDWEKAGDYLHVGLAGTEFYASPRPRWESLHDLQGLAELWRVGGDARYREAMLHHWRSIARFDRHNTGGFSSGEQATGNPWNPAPVETCCTVAWMALSVDALQLTGDPRVADELELSLLNGGLGAQHPSGRWWTYNTPMDGIREASAHSIVFQARAASPELNCCSVNGPRVLGSLADWAVLKGAGGLAMVWHGPMAITVRRDGGAPLRLRSEGRYPLDGRVRWMIDPGPEPREQTLRFRIPGWSAVTHATLNGRSLDVPAGPEWLAISRRWERGDTVDLEFDMAVRAVPGDREALGRIALYRGPILLAFDPRHTAFDEDGLPPVQLGRLREAEPVPDRVEGEAGDTAPRPWLLVDVPGQGGRSVRLCDFAGAGATGRRYRSWLPADELPPPPAITRAPKDGAVIGDGPTTFRWSSRPGPLLHECRLIVTHDPDGRQRVAEWGPVTEPRLKLDATAKRALPTGQPLWWQVVSRGPHGETASQPPLARFVFDPTRAVALEPEPVVPGPDGVVVRAPLQGAAEPTYGRLVRATSWVVVQDPDGRRTGAIRLNGRNEMLVYELAEDFGEDYAALVWVRVNELPGGRIGQVLSCWAAAMDDPLRLTVEGDKLFARIEAQRGWGTRGVPVAVGEWHHIAAVKSGSVLTLYVDGQARELVQVTAGVITAARTCALGGNPNYSGNEYLAADFADFEVFARALGADEVAARYRRGTGER